MKFFLVPYSALILLVLVAFATSESSYEGQELMADEALDGKGAELVMEGGAKKSRKMGKKKKKKTSKDNCVIKDVLHTMTDVIKSLSSEIHGIKVALSEKCPNFLADQAGNDTDYMDSVEKVDESLDTLNETLIDDMTDMEGEDMDDEMDDEDELPPIPTECPAPFQPVASGCFYFLSYPMDWKSWGESNSFCQSLGGALGAPARPQALRTYLKENFSNIFWVGARRSTNSSEVTFEWINGVPMSDSEWKEGQPKQPAHKFCIYLEFFSGYKAVNHYCGEKFPFICEYTKPME